MSSCLEFQTSCPRFKTVLVLSGRSLGVAMKNITAAALIALGVLLASPVWGWNKPGHMVVASVAYQDLNSDERERVLKVLKKHPAYSNWKAAYNSSQPGIAFTEFIFMRAARWPDDIRDEGDQNHDLHEPDWHFVDYELDPVAFPFKDRPSPNADVIFAIGLGQEIANDPDAKERLRAIETAWLFHLVGDVHQPLHCATLISTELPDGDHGGNYFWIQPKTAPVKLHSFWDGLVSTSNTPKTLHNTAVRIRHDHPASDLPELTQETTSTDWSKTTRKHAIDDAYEFNGTIIDGKHTSKTPTNAPAPPDGYTGASKDVAEKQAALAGYRLAKTLQQIP